ncbi:MAG: hypothetical protein JRE38_06760 [Deltaproteobacteria bacterium]|nr:hypothetical protein [Deltaproteobacteria bacterium]MBW2577753.1 hypothetical protein [Deltaproteobacteria bacterium]MBW2691607.1 hypothetical protein [Deltaproteobacteria bacterium]
MKTQPGVCGAALAISSALGIALAMSALAPTRSMAGDFHPYRSEFSRFSVDYPGGSPTVLKLAGSKFTTTGNDINYAVIFDGVEFAVETHDVPRFAMLVLTSHYVLERSVSGKLEDIGARAISVVETSFQGEPAREVDFEASDRAFAGKMLLVLADRRIYLVSVQHPSSIDPPDASAQFFESFSFWLE